MLEDDGVFVKSALEVDCAEFDAIDHVEKIYCNVDNRGGNESR